LKRNEQIQQVEKIHKYNILKVFEIEYDVFYFVT